MRPVSRQAPEGRGRRLEVDQLVLAEHGQPVERGDVDNVVRRDPRLRQPRRKRLHSTRGLR